MNELQAIKRELNDRCAASEKALRDYCEPYRNEMGLVTDEAKGAEYKALKVQFDRDFAALRSFNQTYRKLRMPNKPFIGSQSVEDIS